MEIETDLAKASMTRVEKRDPNATYHKMKLAGLQRARRQFAWKSYLRQHRLRRTPGMMNVGTAGVLQGGERYADRSGRSPTGRRISAGMSCTTRAAAELSSSSPENFHFYGKILTGAKEIRPRWKRALNVDERRASAKRSACCTCKKYFPPAGESAGDGDGREPQGGVPGADQDPAHG